TGRDRRAVLLLRGSTSVPAVVAGHGFSVAASPRAWRHAPCTLRHGCPRPFPRGREGGLAARWAGCPARAAGAARAAASGYFGLMRIAPSRRIVSPLSIGFS